MRNLSRWCAVSLAAIALALSLSAHVAAQPCAPVWVPGEGISGVDGPVYASIVHDDGSGPSLFVGGNFGVAGNVRVHGIARWDGQAWHAVGALEDLPDGFTVGALAVWNGALFAGVFFDGYETPNSAIFRWDGLAWTPLPTGSNTYVTSMTVFNGDLIVAGSIRTSDGQGLGRVARWDGVAWNSLGLAPFSIRVNALLTYGGDLYIGGRFLIPGDPKERHIAKFDGTLWTIPGGGLGGPEVAALAEYHGELIATGNFGSYGTSPIAGIARWDGVSWIPLGEGFDSGANWNGGLALAVFQDELIVGGELDFWYRAPLCDDSSPWGMARWDGSCWRSAGLTPFYTVYSLAAFNGALFAGSWSSGYSGNCGFWDGVSWSPPGFDPYAGPVTAVSSFEGSPIIGGYFRDIGEVPALHVATRRDGRWEPLGNGIEMPVHALAVYRGQLIAGGSTAYQSPSYRQGGRIKAWNGAEWVPLINGLGAEASADALLVVGDGLIGAGLFPLGNTTYSSVARWDGQTWQPMGGYSGVLVSSLAYFNGDILGAGLFQGQGNCVARWDGQSWVKVGDSMQSFPTSLVVYQERLYAAGQDYIARFDAGSWNVFPNVRPADKCLLHVHNGSLYAVSQGMWSGDQWAGNIARFDGIGWSPVIGKFNVGVVDPFAESLFANSIGVLASDGPDLLFGGNFTRAGDTVSAYLARFAASNPADINLDGFLDPIDYNLFLNLFESGDPGADVNHDGFIDPLDYHLFLNNFEAGC